MPFDPSSNTALIEGTIIYTILCIFAEAVDKDNNLSLLLQNQIQVISINNTDNTVFILERHYKD